MIIWIIFVVRFNNEEVPADEEDLLKNLTLASESVWLQLFVIIIVAVTCIFIMINIIGCAGTCMMSYSLLSGFTIFMMVTSILAVTVACSLLLPLHSSNMDSPLAPLVSIASTSFTSSNVKLRIRFDIHLTFT